MSMLMMRHQMGNRCWVCNQNTLPVAANGATEDPENPDRYKVCNVCGEKVPYNTRRTKAYKRRWDEENTKNMWQEIQFLKEPQSSSS